MEVARKLAISALAACLATGLVHAQEDVRVASEADLAEQWVQLTSSAALGYPAEFVERGDNVCLAMGYAIAADGTTSNFNLLKGWNSSTGRDEPVGGYWDSFAQAGAAALSQWKFQPKRGADVPDMSYTVATLSFHGDEPVNAEALRNRCDVDIHSLVASSWGEFQQGRSVEERERDRRIHTSPLRDPRSDAREQRGPRVEAASRRARP